MKAVILCAGLGTRLRPITDTIPKVMVKIGDKPLLQYHIEWLVGNGIRDIGINLFYLPKAVTDYFGDGSRFGAKIHYSHQETLSETATNFKKFEKFIGNEQCLIIYGDNLFLLGLERFKEFHNTRGGIATIALKEWKDPTSKGIVGLNTDQQILWFKEKPTREEAITNIGNAGIYIVEPRIFSYISSGVDQDFGKDIFPLLLKSNEKIYGYKLTDYHIDIGTPEALEQAQNDIDDLYPRRAIFIDRDGVLNKKPASHDYVKNHGEFVWNNKARELIKKLRDLGFLIIIISNQQGVALGKMAKSFLEELGQKINTDLSKFDTKIDAFYYCMHHKDEKCTCRKPEAGLLFRASSDLKINLGRSFMIGDSDSDIIAAERSGCRGIKIKSDDVNPEEILPMLNK